FVIDGEWLLNLSFDAQPPCIFIDRRNWKMCANVKRFSGRDKAIELLKWRFYVKRRFAANDPAIAQFDVTFFHEIFAGLNSTTRRVARHLRPRAEYDSLRRASLTV